MTNYNERLDEALERLAVAGRGWGVSESVQIESMSSELDEAKQALTEFIAQREQAAELRGRISELKDLRPGKDSDVMHLQSIIDERLAELEQATNPEKG